MFIKIFLKIFSYLIKGGLTATTFGFKSLGHFSKIVPNPTLAESRLTSYKVSVDFTSVSSSLNLKI